MTYRVRFSWRADQSLKEIFTYIATSSSSQTAHRFIEDILKRCYALADAPHCGSARPEAGKDARIIGFRRAVTIYFRVRKSEVRILQVTYRGRRPQRGL